MKEKGLWLGERFSPDEIHHHKLRRILVDRRTAFQHVVIADSFAHGRLLVLNDEIQSAENDEDIYHEALMHPALIAHPAPKNVLILGGGEGASAREALRHVSVKNVTMVDIDGDLVDLCRRHLPSWHRGAFSDPRLSLTIGDAGAFVSSPSQTFDVIVSDLPTPRGPGPLLALHSLRFYRALAQRLALGGALVVQAGPMSAGDAGFMARARKTLLQVFRRVQPYGTYVPSFGLPWGFLIASNNLNAAALKKEKIDRSLAERRMKGLTFYDGETHSHMFQIPKPIRRILR